MLGNKHILNVVLKLLISEKIATATMTAQQRFNYSDSKFLMKDKSN